MVLGRVGCSPWAVVVYESKRVKGGGLRTVESIKASARGLVEALGQLDVAL